MPPLPAAEKRGSQTVPKKNALGDTDWKKRMASDNIEPTMPTVVRIAMEEAKSSVPSMTRSTRFLALKGALIPRMAKTAPARAMISTTALITHRLPSLKLL